MKQPTPYLMLATSRHSEHRSIVEDSPEKRRILEAIDKIEVAIEPGDFNNPTLLTMVTDGIVEYKGNHALRYILQNMAREGLIVAYYCDEVNRGTYEDLAFVSWHLWRQWVAELPVVEQLRESFNE